LYFYQRGRPSLSIFFKGRGEVVALKGGGGGKAAGV